MKSVDTTCSSVYPRYFLSAGSSDAFFITALISSYDAYNRKEMKQRMNEKENGMLLICKLVRWEIGAKLLQKNTKQNTAWLECSVLPLFLTM